MSIRPGMKVIKRDGRREEVSFDKVLKRLKLLASGKHKNGNIFAIPELEIDITPIAQKVINEIKDGITTRELDEFAASTCADLVSEHPDYSILAGRIIISNHQKNMLKSFSDTMEILYRHTDKRGQAAPLLAPDVYKTIMEHRSEFEEMLNYSKDFRFDFFGFKTLEASYFLKAKFAHMTIMETPQHLWLRFSVGIHRSDLADVKETYDLVSSGKLMHATPTLYNSGTPTPQCSSCFLLGMKDSLRGEKNRSGKWTDESWLKWMKEEWVGSIDWAWDQCAAISQNMGGIGLWVHDMRASGSMIRSSGRDADGLVPLLQTFNNIGRYVNQGGRRKGSIAMYCEPWHADIEEFLEMRKPKRKEELRALDLFYALWIPDLFMERVSKALESNDRSVMWSLMCPDESPGLSNVYSDEFVELYEDYERRGLFRKQLPVLDLWERILESQKETGTPYMLYKDHVNERNNQSNVGVVKSSNLCAEVVEVSDPAAGLVAVCNLASIPVNAFYNADGTYDYAGLGHATSVAVKNIDKIIDINYYPTPETERSNMLTRPTAVGVQGWQDLLYLMRYPFESEEAAALNKKIFETMYYYAVKTSVELAKKKGAYPMFKGSPTSQGKFQFDLWNEHAKKWNARHPNDKVKECVHSGMYDWEALRKEMVEHGLRNSLLLSNMPTASTAQIQGNVEAFEPITYNLYVRRVLSGEFKCVNQYLQKDLIKLGLWTKEVRNALVANRGSIQNIDGIPKELKDLYKTAFEVKQRAIIRLAAERAPYIDQTQSMNIFVSEPNNDKLTSIHMHAWKNLLKTGMYYLRRETIANAVAFTVDPTKKKKEEIEEEEVAACRRDNPDCQACSA